MLPSPVAHHAVWSVAVAEEEGPTCGWPALHRTAYVQTSVMAVVTGHGMQGRVLDATGGVNEHQLVDEVGELRLCGAMQAAGQQAALTWRYGNCCELHAQRPRATSPWKDSALLEL